MFILESQNSGSIVILKYVSKKTLQRLFSGVFFIVNYNCNTGLSITLIINSLTVEFNTPVLPVFAPTNDTV